MKFKDKFIFGTASLHHLLSKRKIFKLLDIAYGEGFRVYDTSPYYGLGFNEYALFQWIKRRGHLDVTIHTKIGMSYPFYRSRNFLQFLIQRSITSVKFRERVRLSKDEKFYNEYQEIKVLWFLHEPLRHKDYETILEKFSLEGIAGDYNFELRLKNAPKYNLQIPFKYYPKGDIYYGIFSYQQKFNPSLNGRFIYATKNKERIVRFRKNYEGIY